MRKTGISFKQIYKLTKRFFKKIKYKEKKNSQRGRPRKYKDEFIIAIFLYQTLKQYSYREVLQELKYFGFKTPSLNDYHYRIKQFNENTLKLLLEKTGQYFIEKTKDKIQCYIADATGFAYGDIYSLKWRRGIEVKQIKSHIRLELIIAVDNKNKVLILGCETGKAYASEIKMLNQILNKVDFIKGLPFIADKGYDSISVIQKILDIGLIPAIKIKETLRVKIKHPLRQLSKNMAKKLAIAWAILWNFYMILIYVFLFILSVLIFRISFFDFCKQSL
jgi:Transposase DDE domain.